MHFIKISVSQILLFISHCFNFFHNDQLFFIGKYWIYVEFGLDWYFMHFIKISVSQVLLFISHCFNFFHNDQLFFIGKYWIYVESGLDWYFMHFIKISAVNNNDKSQRLWTYGNSLLIVFLSCWNLNKLYKHELSIRSEVKKNQHVPKKNICSCLNPKYHFQ